MLVLVLKTECYIHAGPLAIHRGHGALQLRSYQSTYMLNYCIVNATSSQHTTKNDASATLASYGTYPPQAKAQGNRRVLVITCDRSRAHSLSHRTT
jgi:hypothetical protein